jgi:hypothetical protein
MMVIIEVFFSSVFLVLGVRACWTTGCMIDASRATRPFRLASFRLPTLHTFILALLISATSWREASAQRPFFWMHTQPALPTTLRASAGPTLLDFYFLSSFLPFFASF